MLVWMMVLCYVIDVGEVVDCDQFAVVCGYVEVFDVCVVIVVEVGEGDVE